MSKLAVIKTGGKQYLVSEGDIIKVEKLSTDKDNNFIFDSVLLLSDDQGANLKIGTPELKEIQVEAQILEQGRTKKIRVVKYKPKTRYHKVYGHRQPFTKIKITKIK